MPRKILLLIITGFFVFLWVSWFVLNFPALKAFAELRDKELPKFSAHPIDEETERFLEMVKTTWILQSRETPDSVFAEIASATGVDESVEGVVAFHTFTIPDFSFFDHRRNKQAVAIATAQAIALPISVDNQIHAGEGICYIKLTNELVEVIEDGADGLIRTLYAKPKAGEAQGDAPVPSRPEGD